eukprot:365209-Chlamydomonas_euryale.AAC.6
MGRPTTIISVFAAFIKSPYFQPTASTIAKSTAKSSGESASDAELLAYTSARMREMRSIGNAPPDFRVDATMHPCRTPALTVTERPTSPNHSPDRTGPDRT